MEKLSDMIAKYVDNQRQIMALNNEQRALKEEIIFMAVKTGETRLLSINVKELQKSNSLTR